MIGSGAVQAANPRTASTDITATTFFVILVLLYTVMLLMSDK